MSEALPGWLDSARKQLQDMISQGRLPHALLVSGAEGLGKYMLANWLAAALLCEQAPGKAAPCGSCAACRRVAGNSHPDLLILQPEDAGKAIKVDPVRELGTALGMTSHSGQYKLAIIAPADAMNVNAANSLLKTLEEPTSATLLILLTDRPGALPATVRSRCQEIRVQAPDRQTGLDWLIARQVDCASAGRYLAMAAGAPLKALSLVEAEDLQARDRCLDELMSIFAGRADPLKVAENWSKDVATQRQIMQWWLHWLHSLVRWQQAGIADPEAEVAEKLRQIVEKVDCKQVFGLSDRLARAIPALSSGLNRQLLLEDLLIDWAGLKTRTMKKTG